MSEARRLRSLEEENSRLKKLLAEAMLDNAVLKDLASKMVTPGAKREAVAHARERHGVSERRACALVGVSRRVIRYVPSRPDDRTLRQRLRSWRRNVAGSAIAAWAIYWRERASRPTTRSCCASTARRLAGGAPWRPETGAGHARPMVLPDGPNQRWSLDFVSDSLICGRRFRILCVVDDYTRECLALVADTSLSGVRVARELTSLMGSRGKAARWSATMAPN